MAVLSSGGPESLGSLRSSGATEGRCCKGGVLWEVLCLGVVFFSYVGNAGQYRKHAEAFSSGHYGPRVAVLLLLDLGINCM